MHTLVFLTISQSSHFKSNYSQREIPSCFLISAEFRTIKYFYTISVIHIWPATSPLTPWDSQFEPQWAVRNCKNLEDPDSIFYQLLQLLLIQCYSELMHYFIISLFIDTTLIYFFTIMQYYYWVLVLQFGYYYIRTNFQSNYIIAKESVVQ